jgi:hypothetical protein
MSVDLAADNKRLRDALTQAVAVQQRMQEDTYWRTNDNSLWPDLCAATKAGRAALENSSE